VKKTVRTLCVFSLTYNLRCLSPLGEGKVNIKFNSLTTEVPEGVRGGLEFHSLRVATGGVTGNG
jgi:hypothetical protein